MHEEVGRMLNAQFSIFNVERVKEKETFYLLLLFYFPLCEYLKGKRDVSQIEHGTDAIIEQMFKAQFSIFN